MQGFEIAVTLKGTSIQDVLKQAQALIDADHGTALAVATTGKKGKKPQPAAPVEDDDILLASDDEVTEDTPADEDDALSFDDATDEEPAAKKTKKLTDKDVNAACMAHARKHGKAKTLALLAKTFKVKSILELKPELYSKAIAALKV